MLAGLQVQRDVGCQSRLTRPLPPPPHAATTLDADTLEAIAGDAPSASLPRDQLVGATLADVMVAVGMQPSKAAVRRMIKVGGCWHMVAGWLVQLSTRTGWRDSMRGNHS